MKSSTTSSNFKKIIVLGSGWSGSSAIFEYLRERTDVEDPFSGEELRIIQDTYGIEYLYNTINENFTPSTADFALKMFRNTWVKVARLQVLKNFFTRNKKDFITSREVILYVNSITHLRYLGTNSNLTRQSNYTYNIIATILRKVFDRFKIHLKLNTIYLPVQKEEFELITMNWLNNLIERRLTRKDIKNVIIEQAGNFWNPKLCQKFFGEDTQVLVIHRNPLDTFAEIKQDGHPYPSTVEDYTEWYNNTMFRIQSVTRNSRHVKNINFEDFVTEFDKTRRDIENFLSLERSENCNFDITKSLKNVEKYKMLLSNYEISYLKENIKNYSFV